MAGTAQTPADLPQRQDAVNSSAVTKWQSIGHATSSACPPESGMWLSLGSRLKTLHPSVIQRLELLILVTVVITVTTSMFVPGVANLGKWGYPGAFFINGLSTATLLLPAPGIAFILSMANELNPFLLGVAAGLGGTLGSLTAYWAGVQGRQALEGKRFHRLMLAYMERSGGWGLFLFSSLAILPGDVASVVAGATRYPLRKYLLYVGAGNVVKMVLILYVMTRYFDWAADWLRRFM